LFLDQWLETLQDCFTWKIIGYEDIVPIYEIFEERTRISIMKTFGICHFSTGMSEMIKDFRLCHGLLFRRDGIRLARKCAVDAKFSIEESPNTKPFVQLVNTHSVRDTFIYANNLEVDKKKLLLTSSEAFSRFEKDSPLYNENPDEAVIFRIDKELWNIHVMHENVKPTDEFVGAITKAIECDTARRALEELEGVFAEYGYWWNCKIKIGCRLQHFTQLLDFEQSEIKVAEVKSAEWLCEDDTLGKCLTDDGMLKDIFASINVRILLTQDNVNDLYDELRKEWSERIRLFEANYLLAADNSVIKIR
jgi:hypothetical protein